MSARDTLAEVLYDLAPYRDRMTGFDTRPEHVREEWRATADAVIAAIRAMPLEDQAAIIVA